MNVRAFREAFWQRFDRGERDKPTYAYWDPFVVKDLDLCPAVEGMLSIKKQRLLNLAFSFIEEGEAYLEIGTYKGKSLISAMINNPPKPVFACDNFSEFEGNSYEVTRASLEQHGLSERVTFYDCDFRKIFTPERLPLPIGFYFYDGAHDRESQYTAIHEVEPFLADTALVFVDDWRFGQDSLSYAKPATLKAMRESACRWRVMYELPARMNGDQAMWWNGIGVLSFERHWPQTVT